MHSITVNANLAIKENEIVRLLGTSQVSLVFSLQDLLDVYIFVVVGVGVVYRRHDVTGILCLAAGVHLKFHKKCTSIIFKNLPLDLIL